MSKPVEISGSAVEDFDLRATAEALRRGPEYASNGRSAQTLAKAPEVNVVLTVIKEGASLDQHQAPGSVTLSVIDGKIAFISETGERDVAAGGAVVFAGGVPHSVRGVEDSAFLLVIAQPR